MVTITAKHVLALQLWRNRYNFSYTLIADYEEMAVAVFDSNLTLVKKYLELKSQANKKSVGSIFTYFLRRFRQS